MGKQYTVAQIKKALISASETKKTWKLSNVFWFVFLWELEKISKEKS